MTIKNSLFFSTLVGGRGHRKLLNYHGLRQVSRQNSAFFETLGIVASIGTGTKEISSGKTFIPAKQHL